MPPPPGYCARRVALVRHIVLLITASLLIAGCGADDSSEDGKASSTVSDSTKSSPPDEPDPSETVHKIGEGIKLDATTTTDEGDRAELRLSVRPIRVSDPAANPLLPADEVERGTRWVRVEVRITNQGSDSYNRALGAWTIVDEQGEEGFNNLSSAPWRALGNSRLLPGDSRRGSVAFLVAKGSGLDELRWSPVNGREPIYRWDVSHPKQ